MASTFDSGLGPNEPGRLLTYADVAKRIEEVLGVKVSPVTLRAEMSVLRDRDQKARSRPGAGMPAPVVQPGAGQTTYFDEEQVEAWLRQHPLLSQRAALEKVMKLGSGDDEDALTEAVIEAVSRGASWAKVAHAIAAARGASYSAQAAHQRYAKQATEALRNQLS